MANDWGYAINGKTDIYEDILLELIENYTESDLFSASLEQSESEWSEKIYEYIDGSLDFADIIKDYPETAKDFADSSKSALDIILKLPLEDVLDDTLKDFAAKFDLPDSAKIKSSILDFVINYTMDFVDVISLIITYETISDQVDGILEVCEQMYRNTRNSELRVALKRIIDKFYAVNDEQKWDYVKKKMFSDKLGATTYEEVVMGLLNVIGLGIKTGGLLTEATYYSESLAAAQLLLEAELDIENEIKNVIRYGQNTFKNSVTSARRFNTSFMFLYEAYEYGIEVVKDYNDAVFAAKKNVIQMKYDTEDIKDLKAAEQEFWINKHTHDEFENAIKTWEAIIKNDRTLFASAWYEYKTNKNAEYKELEKKIEEYKNTNYVTGIYFEQEAVTLNKDEITSITTMLSKPKVNPSDADNPVLLYTSSDPSILSIPNERVYGVQIHGTGTVTVTATTLEGYHSASQTVKIIDSKTEEEIPEEDSSTENGENATAENATPPEPKYAYAYEENETGITVNKVIDDFVDTTTNFRYVIPSTLDGKVVTEVDFSEADYIFHLENGEERLVEYVVLPDTVTKIADHCFDFIEPKYTVTEGDFATIYKVKVVLNEGIETIGEYAFREMDWDELVIPSTVTSIGKSAFEYCGADKIIIKSENLTNIPEACFRYTTANDVVFTGGENKLTEIGKEAFSKSYIARINLPDSVEVLNERAFEHCHFLQMSELPTSLKEIGDYCFYNSNVTFEYIPETVKRIGTSAFLTDGGSFTHEKLTTVLGTIRNTYTMSVSNTKLNMEIPNSIEYIGENAFDNSGISSITCYGESNTSSAVMEEGSFAINNNGSYVQIPASVTKLDCIFKETEDLPDISTNFIDKYLIEWTNGLDEIACDTREIREGYEWISQSRLSLYLNEIDRNGDYTIDGHIFFNHEYFNYIEIPTNYLKNSTTALSGKWMKEVVLIGQATKEELDRYTMILKDAVDEGGRIQYKDENGNLSLLYEQPDQRYSKQSQAIYEKSSDYEVEDAYELLPNVYEDKEKTLSMKASYSDKTAALIGAKAKFNLKEWVDEGETAIERAEMIPNIAMFEDLYLVQPVAKYFEISLEADEDVDLSEIGDKFVFSIKTQELIYRHTVALYHISDKGRITRIPLHFDEDKLDCVVTFETSQLGQFALVSLVTFKKVIESPYLEELNNYYSENRQVVHKESPVTYNTKEGIQLIIGEDSRNESTVETTKPEIDEEIKEEVIRNLQIEEDTLEGSELWQTVESSFVKIDTGKEDETIQVALTKLPENYNALHLFKTEENGGKQTLVDVTDTGIEAINESKANKLLVSNDREYYHIDLEEAGTYYFMLTKSENAMPVASEPIIDEKNDSDIEEKASSNSVLMILIVFIVLLMPGVIFVANKKKKRR